MKQLFKLMIGLLTGRLILKQWTRSNQQTSNGLYADYGFRVKVKQPPEETRDKLRYVSLKELEATGIKING